MRNKNNDYINVIKEIQTYDAMKPLDTKDLIRLITLLEKIKY